MGNNLLKLFIENNKALENVKGSWGMYGFQMKGSALSYTMKNQRVDTERVNLALDIITNNTSIFSNFRGMNKLTTAITISFEENMENSFREIRGIYDSLKENFYNNSYLVITALVIYNARERVNPIKAVKNTKLAYDYMKQHHRFLTGQEDISNAAIIATTSNNLEKTFIDIEKCYEYLKDRRISSSNNIQGLSHMLSLINMSYEDKCNSVIKMNDILKSKRVALKSYYLPMLGIVAFLDDNQEAVADSIVEVDKVLKQEKGFGNFLLGADFRNMISAALVSHEYIENMDENIKENIANNTNNIALTVAIAVQTAIMISSASAAAAASSSSSSS